jgi:hypothetical protein
MPQWKPGQSGNPKGRPKYILPDYVKDAALLNRPVVERFFAAYMAMSLYELETKLKDKNLTVLEMMVGRLCLEAMKSGDQSRFDFVLNRTIGKVMDRVEHTVVKPMLIERPSGEQILLTNNMALAPTAEDDDADNC